MLAGLLILTIATQLGGGSDYDFLVSAMNYSHHHVPGVCVEKSLGFETLAKEKGFKVEHLAIICGVDCSHATSRVWLNDSWVYFDAFFNKVYTVEEYKAEGYYKGIRHINCIDVSCSNYNSLQKLYFNMFYIREVW